MTKGVTVKTWNTGKRIRTSRDYAPEWKRGVFAFSGNTGTYSIEAAALMGFSDIRLLGIDLRFDLPTSHFFGRNPLPSGAPRRYNRRRIAEVVKCYGAIAAALKNEGISVVNESCYDGPLDDVLPREESPWLKK